MTRIGTTRPTRRRFVPELATVRQIRPRGMLLVSATATLNDGTTLPAFITPDSGDVDVGTMQPYVFVGDTKYGFWRTPDDVRQDFYAALRTEPTDAFPLRVAGGPGLSGGAVETAIAEWLPPTPLQRLRGLFRGRAGGEPPAVR